MPAALFDLSDKTALVTGASRGIGQAMAVGLAEAGAHIIAAARSTAGLGQTRTMVEACGRRCTVLPLDVTDGDAVSALASLEGPPTILVNNAGVEEVSPSTDVSEAVWDRIVDTNLKGSFFVAQAFAKALMARSMGGSIINLGSLTSAAGVPTAVPYTASKAGVLGMTRALCAEWAPHGIRVNAIGPGYFRTELTEVFYQNAAWQEAMRAKIPIGRFGKLEDLKGAAVFLASDASAYVTGQILYVDGGTLASL